MVEEGFKGIVSGVTDTAIFMYFAMIVAPVIVVILCLLTRLFDL
jgi:hypothetical protein